MSGLRIETGRSQRMQHGPAKNKNNNDEGFKALVKGAIKRVNDAALQADRNIEKMASGKAGIHETMISMQKADISFRFLLQIRNKALEAYREIMRMPF